MRRRAIALPALTTLIVLCAAFGAALPHSVSAAAAPRFLAGTEDVPLMPGLRSDAKTLVVFDKPQGRIVEVEARGKVTRAAVEKFYETNLPALGWTADGKDAWQRDGEGLRLDIKGRDGALRVGFSLAPR
jgi:hypothetical protein